MGKEGRKSPKEERRGHLAGLQIGRKEWISFREGLRKSRGGWGGGGGKTHRQIVLSEGIRRNRGIFVSLRHQEGKKKKASLGYTVTS